MLACIRYGGGCGAVGANVAEAHADVRAHAKYLHTHTHRRADATSRAVMCSETASWGLTCEVAAEDLKWIAVTCCRCACGHLLQGD